MKSFLVLTFVLSNCGFVLALHLKSLPENNCSEITLGEHEFNFTGRGSVQTIYSKLIFDKYRRNEDSVSLCFPFSKYFQECLDRAPLNSHSKSYPSVWKMPTDKMQKINETRNYLDIRHHIEYELGDYFIDDDGDFIVCIPESQLPHSLLLFQLDDLVLAVGWPTSAVFTVLVFVIYWRISCLATSLKPLPSSLASLFFAYVFFAISSNCEKIENEILCYSLAIGLQFSVISATCWMNVVSFDTWWRFRSHQIFRDKNESNLIFSYLPTILQNVYGWGIAFVIVIASITLELQKDSPFRPNYFEVCEIYNPRARILMYYGPITLCQLINLILFVLTAVSLFRVRRYISMGKSRIQLLCLSMKLMIVMGIPWCLQVIKLTVNIRPECWIILNVIISFQGVFFFFVYICRQNVKSELKTIMVAYITYYCCFCIAKRVAITPLRKTGLVNNNDLSSTQITETSI